MENINCKELEKAEISVALFDGFNRYQDVKKCWRKENEKWVLKEIAFTEQWGEKEYEQLVKCLQNTVETGGAVFGAFHNNALAGFASVENQFFGSEKEYLQLSSIHCSYEERGRGIGKELFSLACKKAKDMGAQKLYISAHSSQESQAFYKAMGCVEAKEYNDKLVAEEPCDCQLEVVLMLETDRLLIRKFCYEDWDGLYEYLSQETVVKYEPYTVFNEEQCKQEAVNRSKNSAFWAVCLKENNKLIGNVYFQQQEPKEFLTWEIGYVFNPAYYGKGYATEACKRVLKYGFKELGAHRILAHCNPENTSSWRLLERLSMRREGHFRKPAFFFKSEEGKPIWHDAYQYAILKEEIVETYGGNF